MDGPPGRLDISEGPTTIRLRILTAATALFPLLPAAAPALTWHVPAQAPTIAAGLDSAAAGDTVLVACGTYAETGLSLKTGVTLRGATGDPACATIHGGLLGRILDAAHVTDARVEGLTLQQGTTAATSGFDAAGGAIRCDSSEVAITDCFFTGNSAPFGAAVGLRATNVAITDCTFFLNAATGPGWAAGGGVWAQRSSGDVLRCTFTSNLAAAGGVLADGGGIFAERSDLHVTDCTFTDNDAQAGGGGMYSYLQDKSLVRGTTFQGNTAGAGGAMYFETSYAAVVDVRFRGNTGASGGAVFIEKGSYPFFGECLFDGNRATPFSGGAVDCWKSDPVFRDCRFLGNDAVVRGGAIGLHTTSSATLEGCFLARNDAGSDGGAIWAIETTTTALSRCTIATNSAGGAGGAIHAADQATVTVDASVLAFATAGEAVSCAGTASVTLTCSNLYGNAGGDWVGCVASQAGGAGNLSADPLFCDLAGDDDRVTLPDSPCLAANNACGVAIGSGDAGCGCPTGATILVPSDQPTIAAALAAAVPGDVIGVCSGTYAETLELVDGVHVVGVRSDLAAVQPPGAGNAVVHASALAGSTLVADLRLDGAGLVPAVVSADSGTTGLHLARNAITGGSTVGVLVGPDARVRVGGELALANDLFGNGGGAPLQLRNENVTADSLDALLNWWGTTAYDVILGQIEGPVRSCPVTDASHTKTLCAPLSALAAPPRPAGGGVSLTAGPNPFRHGTELRFVLPGADPRARLLVVDVAGRRVRAIAVGEAPGGRGVVRWTGTDERGRAVAPGVYFVRLESAAGTATRRLVRLR